LSLLIRQDNQKDEQLQDLQVKAASTHSDDFRHKLSPLPLGGLAGRVHHPERMSAPYPERMSAPYPERTSAPYPERTTKV